MYYFMLPLMMTLAEEPVPIEPAKLSRTEAVDYVKEIQPLLAAKCTTCHSGKELKAQYDMGSHAGVLAGGKRKAAVIPGKPLESNLYTFSAHIKKPVMPPLTEGNDLTPQEVALLKLWIEQGAKGPKSAEVRVRPAVTLAVPIVKPVRALAMHPTKNVLAVGRGSAILLIDAKTGETLNTLPGHLSLVESLAFSPDGAILASGSFREVFLWNVEAKTISARLGGFADKVVSLSWSPKNILATGGGAPTEDGEVRLFDIVGKPVFEFKSPHSDTVFGVAFNADGTKLLSGGADKFVRVWDIPGGKLVKSFEGHTQHVLDVAWSPDGKRVVSAGADDLIKIWDLEKGERVRDLKTHTRQVQRLAAVGKSGSVLAVDGDGKARRWNLEGGDNSRNFDGAKDALYAVAANADGTLVATGGEDGLVRLYDGKTAQLLKTVTFEK